MPSGSGTRLHWLHLTVGVLVSVVVTPMAATGALLAFQPELTAWFERDVQVTGPGDARLSPTELVRRAALELPPDARPSMVQLERSPFAPVVLETEVGFWLLDPHDGHVLRPSQVRTFFRAAEEVHWSIGLAFGRLRRVGTTLAGLAAIGVLLLSLTGLWLWWPSRSGPVRDWHRVIGIWCMPVLLVASTTGILLHYQGLRDVVGEVLGEQAEAKVLLDADDAVREAMLRAPEWSAIRLRWPDDGSIALRVRFGGGVRPTQWAELDSGPVDASGARQVSLRRYDDGRRGDKLFGWVRWLHTGQALGRAGQAAWGAATLGIFLLIWTGLAQTLRRVRRMKVGVLRSSWAPPADR